MASIKIRYQTSAETTEIRVLIQHPMENGRNRDASTGELIPAHYIQQVELRLNNQPLLSIDMGGSMAKNPYFSLQVKPLMAGDRLTVRWLDNRQQSDQTELLVSDSS